MRAECRSPAHGDEPCPIRPIAKESRIRLIHGSSVDRPPSAVTLNCCAGEMSSDHVSRARPRTRTRHRSETVTPVATSDSCCVHPQSTSLARRPNRAFAAESHGGASGRDAETRRVPRPFLDVTRGRHPARRRTVADTRRSPASPARGCRSRTWTPSRRRLDRTRCVAASRSPRHRRRCRSAGRAAPHREVGAKIVDSRNSWHRVRRFQPTTLKHAGGRLKAAAVHAGWRHGRICRLVPRSGHRYTVGVLDR